MDGYILPIHLHIKAAYELTQMIFHWWLDMRTSNFYVQSQQFVIYPLVQTLQYVTAASELGKDYTI